MKPSLKNEFLSLTLFAFFTALFFGSVTWAVPTGRAVVGIDYGTSNVRMGMLRSGVGSVEIVLSFESDRKTINAVAYRDESVLFSQTAMNMVNFIYYFINIFIHFHLIVSKVP